MLASWFQTRIAGSGEDASRIAGVATSPSEEAWYLEKMYKRTSPGTGKQTDACQVEIQQCHVNMIREHLNVLNVLNIGAPKPSKNKSTKLNLF